jgi:hypothetical protein
MGEIREHGPVLLLLAIFSRHGVALDWARARAEAQWGQVALESPRFPFPHTQFYDAEMGSPLVKQFLTFQSLSDPARLPEIKQLTNQWEREYAELRRHDEMRPLNIDPGYLTEAKLVLATTKDRDHRIYLARGVYAEGTLYYYHRQWQCRPWTYPDYRSPEYHQFFSQCREYLRNALR